MSSSTRASQSTAASSVPNRKPKRRRSRNEALENLPHQCLSRRDHRIGSELAPVRQCRPLRLRFRRAVFLRVADRRYLQGCPMQARPSAERLAFFLPAAPRELTRQTRLADLRRDLAVRSPASAAFLRDLRGARHLPCFAPVSFHKRNTATPCCIVDDSSIQSAVMKTRRTCIENRTSYVLFNRASSRMPGKTTRLPGGFAPVDPHQRRARPSSGLFPITVRRGGVA
jgi:hypothetical protein